MSRIGPVVIAALCLFLVLSNMLWYGYGGAPQHWDSAIHLTESLTASRIGEDSTTSIAKQILNVSWYYPPFTSYVSILFYQLLGESEFVSLQIMSFFLVLLVTSVYGIGARVFGKDVGLLSAALVAFSPIVVQYSRVFMLDLPVAAMVALSIYLLIRTSWFQLTVPTVLLGVALGCGMLTKWTFPAFLIAPIVMTAWTAVRRFIDRRHSVKNIFLTLLIAAVVAVPWYLVHAIQILSGRSTELDRGQESVLDSVLYYLLSIPDQASWLIAIIALIGFGLFIVRRRPERSFFVIWLLGSYLFISLIGFKQPRFSIALLIPLLLMSSAGILELIERRINSLSTRKFILVPIVILSMLQYLAMSYTPSTSTFAGSLGWMGVRANGPATANWQHEAILDTLAVDMNRRKLDRAIFRIIPDQEHCNNATFGYAAKRGHVPVLVRGTSGFPLFTDYVLLKIGGGSDTPERERLIQTLLAETSRTSMYEELRRFPLPDGGTAVLLRVAPKILKTVPARKILAETKRSFEQFLVRYLKPVSGVSLELEAYSNAETQRGHLKRVLVRADSAELGDFSFTPNGIRVHNVIVSIEDVRFDPASLLRDTILQIVSLGGLRVESIGIDAADLHAYLGATLGEDFGIDSLTMMGGTIDLKGRVRKEGVGIAVGLRIERIGTGNIGFSFDHATIGNLPLPSWLLNIAVSPFNPLLTGLTEVREVHLNPITIGHNQLLIQPPAR